MKHIIEMSQLVDYYVVVVKDKSTGALIESFTLNESAADMLRLLCKGKDLETIAQEIAQIYDAPLELITLDAIKLKNRLSQKNLI